jgi:hypothetical protein
MTVDGFLDATGTKINDDWVVLLQEDNSPIPTFSTDSADGNQDISITSNTYWNLNFSSSANHTYFSGPAAITNTLKNDAWIGDDRNCAFMT